MNPKLEHWHLERFKPDPRELARHDDPEKTRLLGLDLLSNGLLHAVAAVEDGRLISGHGRLLGARSVGLKTLLTSVYPATITDAQVLLLRGAENLQRTDLTGHGKWVLATELKAATGWDQTEIAKNMHLSEPTVCKILSPSRCTEAWQTALREGKVTISDCYTASKAEVAAQNGLLALKLSGANREALEAAARKPRAAPAVKLDRVKLVIPGCTLTVTGAGIDLEHLIESLSAILEQARKANKDNLDIKTLVRVMADKAGAKS